MASRLLIYNNNLGVLAMFHRGVRVLEARIAMFQQLNKQLICYSNIIIGLGVQRYISRSHGYIRRKDSVID